MREARMAKRFLMAKGVGSGGIAKKLFFDEAAFVTDDADKIEVGITPVC